MEIEKTGILAKKETLDVASWVKSDFADSISSIVGHFLAQANMSSKNTHRAYERVVWEFFSWARTEELSINGLADINHKVLDYFLLKETQRSASQKTAWYKMTVISALFEFALDRRYFDGSNPVKLLRRPKYVFRPKNPTMPLSKVDVDRIISYLNQRIDERQDSEFSLSYKSLVVNRLIFVTLVHLGMRAKELSSIRVGDLEETAGRKSLRLTLKGSKPHQVPIPEIVCSYMAHYLERYRPLASADEPLFISAKYLGSRQKPQAISPESISKMMENLALRVGVAQKVSAHTLRATAACNLWERGVPIPKIQRLLGHANPRTTWLYLSRFVADIDDKLWD